MNVVKSCLFVMGVLALGIVFSIATTRVDTLFGLKNLQSAATMILGGTIVFIGAILRFWAVLLFYRQNMKIVSIHSQHKLITSGPYSFSRNPLYLGIVCVAFGSALLFGSISGMILSVVIFIAWDLWVKLREEKQLEQRFGEEYTRYKREVPRWAKINQF